MTAKIAREGGVAGAVPAFAASSRRADAAPAALVPFRHAASRDALADLKRRRRDTRRPAGEAAADRSQQVPLRELRALIDHCDSRNTAAPLNAETSSESGGLAIRT